MPHRRDSVAKRNGANPNSSPINIHQPSWWIFIFAKFLLEDTNAISNAKNKILNAEYKISSEEIDTALNKVKNSETLTERDNYVYTEVVAHITEELLGNEDFIKRLARSNRGLFNKIKNYISDKIKSNSKSERYRIAEYLFDNALKEIKEKDGSKSEQIDNSSEMKYAKKGYAKKQFAFQYENFPPDNETHNTAHQDALHWAKLSTVEVAEQRLIHSNGNWYIVEKFSDFTNNYQVVEKISINSFDKILKEIKENGRSGRIKSISTSSDFIDKLNQPSYSLKARESSSDSLEIRYGREDNQVQRLDKNQVERGERIGGYGTRDSSSSSLYRERENVKLSSKDSQGRTLNKAQQDFFKDSKVVDENGNLRVVYHGTVGEFYTFDKTYLGSATGVGDAKLGFFFTSSENVALEYAINAHDTKFFNLANKIANGDNDKLKNFLAQTAIKSLQ